MGSVQFGMCWNLRGVIIFQTSHLIVSGSSLSGHVWTTLFCLTAEAEELSIQLKESCIQLESNQMESNKINNITRAKRAALERSVLVSECIGPKLVTCRRPLSVLVPNWSPAGGPEVYLSQSEHFRNNIHPRFNI